MTPTSCRPHRWQLDRQRAVCSLGTSSATVDLDRPDLGLQSLQVNSAPIEGRLLAVTSHAERPRWPAKLVDRYVRGNDVVATYAGDESWPYAPQIYWSATENRVDSTRLPSLSLIVSIQTSLLDTHPRIFAQSDLRADEALLVSVVGDDLLVDSHVDSIIGGVQGIDPRASACAILWRISGGKLSYAETMPTSDFRQLAVAHAANGRVQSQWELFAEFLEKGVIRRARLQSLWMPRENDVQLVAESCQAAANRPLPLTT
jgi:hypothetical protein